ncbi:MAG: hypothetical protein GY811_06620 [Myxococcales bacterium]|nr:hypothetical protein [Myxococcales bacterium]
MFLLTDKELNLTAATVSPEQLAMAVQGAGLSEPKSSTTSTSGDGPPYQFEPPDTVSPLRTYGDCVLRFTGSTHDEEAFISKDPDTVGKLNLHLSEKIEAHRDEIELANLDSMPGAKDLIVSYGITSGAVRQAVATLRRSGQKVSALTIQSLWPVPETAIAAALEGVERILVAELNLGQYSREIERLAADREVIGLHRFDGRLISPTQIVEALQ